MSIGGRVRAWLARRADPGDDMASAAAAVDDVYANHLRTLETIRRSSAEVLLTRKRLETQAAQLGRSRDELEERARAAATQGRDDVARSALTQALQLERQLADRQKTIDELRAKERELQDSSERLQCQIDDYRIRMEAARARHGAAEAVAAAERASAERRRAAMDPGSEPSAGPKPDSETKPGP